MKIGFDAKRLYTNFTGLGSYSRALVHDLNYYFPDNEYYLYTPKIKDNPATREFLHNPSFRTISPSGIMNPFWRSHTITELLKRENMDLYHGLSHELPLNIERSKIRSIVSIHDLIFKIYPETYSFIDRRIYDWKFKGSCERADKIIAISESTKNDIVNFYEVSPTKVEVIYQTCNPLFYKKHPEEDTDEFLNFYEIPKEYLLYVGSVIPRKNLITILNAYQFLPSDLRIPLVVVGKGSSYKREAEKVASELKISHLIIWLDNLKDTHHLKQLYRKASAFIYPSLYEGFGIPILEALLCKTPVITSKVSSLPEAGGPSSYYLLHPENAEEMAEGIKRVLQTTVLRTRMSEEGYAYAIRNFDPKVITQKVFALYKQVVGK